MKTLKKAIWGIIFLAPLFLPSQTKAGPFDDWLHSEFGSRRQTQGSPYGSDRRSYEFDRKPGPNQDFGYRPYNPWDDRHDPTGAPGGDPRSPNSVPIDGGLVFLLAGGLGLGVWKIYAFRKRSGTVVA